MNAAQDDTTMNDWFFWAYGGVDHALPGNGGDGCTDFIPPERKIVESIVFFTVGVLELCYAWPRIRLPDVPKSDTVKVEQKPGRRILLAAMCLTFGVELGFKLASRQMIWVLNPCHLVTMIQIFLLAAPPSKLVTAMFRIQMHCLNGATIAMILPIINTRLLPFEIHVYYLQHALILIVPFYLLRCGGVYIAEAYNNFTWVLLTLGLLFTYHWLPLQLLAIASQVNLNNMLCPAVSDPFHGVWYRVGAATHQTALIFIHGKLYTYLTSRLLKRHVTETATPSSFPPLDDSVKLLSATANGYTKSE